MTTTFNHPSFAGLIGVAQCDITPPVGIYNRMWGAAPTDRAEGVHRPLLATALVLRPRGEAPPLAIISLDLGWWKSADDEWVVRGKVLDLLGVDESRVIMNLSHTHAGPSLARADADKPGGDLIAPYLNRVAESVASAVQEALESAVPASLSWAPGSCALAVNRDFFDGTRHACGFNPDGEADATVLVGRATDAEGKILATLVNYACHPTTLAWQNRVLSPDFVGGLRDVVEVETGAPCLFLQGASGEFGSREMYTGDTAVADRHGRTLGYVVLSVLNEMLPHATALRYGGIVESGAQLGVWERVPHSPSETAQAVRLETVLPLKESWKADEPDPHWGAMDERVLAERMTRRARLREVLDGGRLNFWVWRLGDALLIAQPNECYSWFQTELRRRFGDTAVVVLNLTNGASRGYLPRAATYNSGDIYQAWQSPYERGSLEQLVDVVEQGVHQHLRPESSSGPSVAGTQSGA